MSTRDYTSVHTIKDFILNDVAPKYFDLDDISLLNVGNFGLITDVASTVAQDNFNTTSRYITEIIPGKSVLPEFVYAQAANYGINDIFSVCSSCNAMLFIREDHILNYGQKEGNYINYIIDSEMKVFIDDIPFSIPYDIKIRARYYNSTYNYNCTYMTSGINNSIAQLTYPYIKSFKTRISGQDTVYIGLNVKLYQYSRELVNRPIVNNSTLNIPFEEFEFDDSLCNFEVIYRDPTGTNETQLAKLLDNEPAINTPFCYYKMVDDGILRLSFTTNDIYFVPEYNSEIDVYLYKSLGKKGNFPVYTGDNIYVAGASNDVTRSYNNEVPLFCIMTGPASGGRDELTLDQLSLKTWEATLSLKSITTDEDLNRYFDSYTSLYDTKALFIRNRDDMANRSFACYTRIRDEDNIYPTNTLNVNVEFSNMGGYVPGQNRYILKPGKRIAYVDGSSTDAVILADDAPEQEMEYTTIALMSMELQPNNMTYYMNSIEKSVPAEYTYINEESIYQFIMKTFFISRNAVEGEERYHIKVILIPTDTNALATTVFVDEYSGNPVDITTLDEEVIMTNKIHPYLIADTQDGHYIPLEFVYNESSQETGYVFECYLDTNDIINSSTLEITNMISSQSGIPETCSLSISNPPFTVLVFYEEDVAIGHKYQYMIPDTIPYTLCNSFKPIADSYYLAYPLHLMNSTLKFLPSVTDPSGFRINVTSVPLFSRKFLLSEKCDTKNVLDQITAQHSYIESALDNITSNFSIYLRFFNTYGKSVIFSAGSDASLNRTFCSIKLGIKLFNGVDDDCFNDIKHTIKTYIEGINTSDESSINSISISQLTTKLHEEYSDKIDAIVFYSINDYDSSVQLITMTKKLDSAEFINTVPEFLTINTDDIILTTL